MSKGVSEIVKAFPGYSPRATVIVGSDVQKNVSEILGASEGGEIYAFEPLRELYDELHAIYGQSDRVFLERRTLGSRSGSAYLTRRGVSVADPPANAEPASANILKVERGDDYFRAEGVDEISHLITNCRSWDIEVLNGFGGYLASRKISFIQMRCSFEMVTSGSRIQDVLSILQPVGYKVVGIFSQSRVRIGESRGAAIRAAEFLFSPH